MYAPGSQGGHGKAEGSWEPLAQIGQKAAVKGALQCFRVKVYLDGGDLGKTSQFDDRRNDLPLLVSGKLRGLHLIGFETYNRHESGIVRDLQGLESRPHHHLLAAQIECAGEKGDSHFTWINKIESLWTFPRPQHNLRQTCETAVRKKLSRLPKSFRRRPTEQSRGGQDCSAEQDVGTKPSFGSFCWTVRIHTRLCRSSSGRNRAR